MRRIPPPNKPGAETRKAANGFWQTGDGRFLIVVSGFLTFVALIVLRVVYSPGPLGTFFAILDFLCGVLLGVVLHSWYPRRDD